jgi:hypothetical protein
VGNAPIAAIATDASCALRAILKASLNQRRQIDSNPAEPAPQSASVVVHAHAQLKQRRLAVVFLRFARTFDRDVGFAFCSRDA